MRNWGIGSGLSGVVVLSIVMLFGGRPATAQIQLIDQNSSVTIVTNSSAGQNHWVVDGSDVLHQQWFWYRVGNTGGQNSICLLYTSPSPRDRTRSRMPSS